MQTFIKLFSLLNRNELKNAIILMVMILIMALLDTIGVASILPFMTVLVNPELIETNIILIKLYEISKIFGVKNNQQFIFALGSTVLVLLIASLTFKSLTTYMQVQFTQMSEFNVAKRLIEGYLHQPYIWFLNRNSSELGKTILSEVSQVIGGGLTPLIEIISKSTIAISLIILLIITDPKLAFIVGVSLGFSYCIIFLFIRDYLKTIGRIRLKNNELRYKIVNESFGASKEVKLLGLEDFFVKRFSKAGKAFAQTQAKLQVLAYLPRYILEAIAFGGILLIILYYISKTGSFGNALPIISLYVFAGYRLMPSLQQIYSAFTIITFAGPALDHLYKEIQSFKRNTLVNKLNDIKFNKSIKLENINFNFLNSSRNVLKNISLEIPMKKTIGLIGATGSGKTTLINIILGLLQPQSGFLKVDDQIISKNNIRSWQKLIGYVPQNIFLADDTISANIAFGLDSKEIDFNKIEKVSNIANLHNFVVNELPEKYMTVVGEHGIRLSGGQRQRIGIARALYLNPKVLILDEATNALDNQTQQAVMDALKNINQNITIILIAHRLETLKYCDEIFKVEDGNLIKEKYN